MTSRKVELARSYLGNWRRNKYLRRLDKRPYLRKRRHTGTGGGGYNADLKGLSQQHSAVAALMLSVLTVFTRKSFFRRRQ